MGEVESRNVARSGKFMQAIGVSGNTENFLLPSCEFSDSLYASIFCVAFSRLTALSRTNLNTSVNRFQY